MRLEQVPIPPEAEERSWQIARQAFADRVPNPRRCRPAPSLPAAVAAALAALVVTAVALGASNSGVIDSIRRAIGVQHAAAVLVRLPAPGRLLVNADSGPWIVSADGSKRHLADATSGQAVWSPHGLYEATVIDGDTLAAIDPRGTVRWSLARPRVSDPRWSADGYRIAYRSGNSLRVVAGDGTGDHLLARRTAAVAAAWQGSAHELAYLGDDERVHLLDADTSQVRWRSARIPAIRAIAWEPDGNELIVLTKGSLRFLNATSGHLDHQLALDGTGQALAVSAAGSVAVTISQAGQSAIELLPDLRAGKEPRVLFHGAGEFAGIAWSPNGHWLLTSWTSADQWVFINLGPHTSAPTRVQAVSSIARQFDAATPPQLAGWCCTSGPPS